MKLFFILSARLELAGIEERGQPGEFGQGILDISIPQDEDGISNIRQDEHVQSESVDNEEPDRVKGIRTTADGSSN